MKIFISENSISNILDIVENHSLKVESGIQFVSSLFHQPRCWNVKT